MLAGNISHRRSTRVNGAAEEVRLGWKAALCSGQKHSSAASWRQLIEGSRPAGRPAGRELRRAPVPTWHSSPGAVQLSSS